MIEFLSGTPSWYSIDELPPVFKVTEAKPTVNQWATVATASSQYSTYLSTSSFDIVPALNDSRTVTDFINTSLA
jgi:hypothetical protein